MALRDLKVGDAVCVEVFSMRHSDPSVVADWNVVKVGRTYLYATSPKGWPRDIAFDRDTGQAKHFRGRAHPDRQALEAERALAALRCRAADAMRKATDYGARNALTEAQCLAILAALNEESA